MNDYLYDIETFYYRNLLEFEAMSHSQFIRGLYTPKESVLTEGTVGDKVKGFFIKLKSFFIRIWQKFIEKLEAWANSNNIKKYLEKYKDIIIGKKVKFSSVKMFDHFTGYARIKNVFNSKVDELTKPLDDNFFNNLNITIIDNIESRAGNMTSNSTEADKLKNENSYKSTHNSEVAKIIGLSQTLKEEDNISTEFTHYFNGSSEMEDFSNSQLDEKMSVMYNSLYEYRAAFDGLKKIKEAYMKSMDKVEQSYKNALQRIESIHKTAGAEQANAKGDENKINKSVQDRDAALQAERDKVKGEAEKFSESTNSVLNAFLEAEINTSQFTSGGAAKSDNIIRGGGNQTNTSKASADTKDTTKTADAKASDIKSSTDKNAANAAYKANSIWGGKLADNVDSSTAAEWLGEFSNLAVKYINAYSNARTTAFAAMLNGLSSMQKEYLQVIRAHVNTYLGTVSDVEDDTNKTAT